MRSHRIGKGRKPSKGGPVDVVTKQDMDRPDSTVDGEIDKTPPAAKSTTARHSDTKIELNAEGKWQPSISDGKSLISPNGGTVVESPDADLPSRSDQASAQPSIFEADVPVIDLREVLAESRRRNGLARLGGVSWAKPLGAALVILAVLGVTVVAALLVSEAPSDETNAVSDVTLAPPPTSAPALAPPVPDTPASTTPTTVAPTTTAATTAATAPAVFIEPVGEGLDVSDLALSALGIGPLRIGTDAGPVLGILTASLGQPDHDSGLVTSEGEYGTCAGDSIRTVQWGPLVVITMFQTDSGTAFHGYTLDLRLPDARGPATALLTLSGLQAGDTVSTLRSIYEARFGLTFTTHPVEGPIFEISGARGVLLWGPLSSTQPEGIVQGIFSPIVCNG